jgi:hypothetical protein
MILDLEVLDAFEDSRFQFSTSSYAQRLADRRLSSRDDDDTHRSYYIHKLARSEHKTDQQASRALARDHTINLDSRAILGV